MARRSSGSSATPTSSTPSKPRERIRATAGSVPRRRILPMAPARRRDDAWRGAQRMNHRGGLRRPWAARFLAPARVLSARSRDRATGLAVGTPATRTSPRASSGIGQAGPCIPWGHVTAVPPPPGYGRTGQRGTCGQRQSWVGILVDPRPSRGSLGAQALRPGLRSSRGPWFRQALIVQRSAGSEHERLTAER